MLDVLVVVSFLAGCGLTGERQKARPDMTLWQTIGALVQQTPFTKAKVENVLMTQLNVKDTSRSPFPNTAFQFYIGGPVQLSDGMLISKVDLRIRHKPGHPGFLVLRLVGGCITLKTVRNRYQDLIVTEYPKGQSLDEALAFSAFLEWGGLSFGFVERNPGCLAYLAFDPKFEHDNVPHQ
ncbi:hypothetical protein LJ656_33255 [Paraburkholderia sp. MMS20-SJTR3]|uniref:Lipoprotein n=1 Tax=Paraburkholderia sejongensis TaxID=2886946 RepID=A0ABS8K5K8_9BURK|nr:hypothetical protein [Paraburkholderia sp. MMS20-SJTR3]MCC8397433.1 hypothetical protein [Paraburkholderia sp. MMS20-SJTR3]